jgi:hypothetical protein
MMMERKYFGLTTRSIKGTAFEYVGSNLLTMAPACFGKTMPSSGSNYVPF